MIHFLLNTNRPHILNMVKSLYIKIIYLFLILLIIEIFLFFFFPLYRNQVFDHELTGGHPVDVNGNGSRGEIIQKMKQQGEYRILVLGDSTTFGTGIPAEATWAKLLQKELEDKNTVVKVINAAVPGSCISEIEVYFTEVWMEYNPDCVILAITGNMISFEWIKRDASPKAAVNGYLENNIQDDFLTRSFISIKRLIKKLSFPSFSKRMIQRLFYLTGILDHNIQPETPYGSMIAHGWIQGDYDQATNQKAWDLFRIKLKSFAEIFSDSNIDFHMTYFPTRFMLSDSYYDNQKCVPKKRITLIPSKIIENISQEENIPYINLFPVIQNSNREDTIYLDFDFIHFNTKGHDIIAKTVAKNISLEF